MRTPAVQPITLRQRQSENPGFPSEYDLVSELQSSWLAKPTQRFSALLEVPSPDGIPDVLLFNLRPDWREYEALGSLPPRWAYLLARLPARRTFDISYLTAQSGSSERRAREAATQFVLLGFCRPGSKRDTWIKLSNIPIPSQKIIAIEAKLRDWKRALAQASRYTAFANESWVLLDDKYASQAAAQIAQFKCRGIGLATLAVNGQLRSLSEAEKRPPHDPISQWFVNCSIISRVG